MEIWRAKSSDLQRQSDGKTDVPYFLADGTERTLYADRLSVHCLQTGRPAASFSRNRRRVWVSATASGGNSETREISICAVESSKPSPKGAKRARQPHRMNFFGQMISTLYCGAHRKMVHYGRQRFRSGGTKSG